LASLGASSPKVHLMEMEVTDYSSFPGIVHKVASFIKKKLLIQYSNFVLTLCMAKFFE
jgi:hypothetical protein